VRRGAPQHGPLAPRLCRRVRPAPLADAAWLYFTAPIAPLNGLHTNRVPPARAPHRQLPPSPPPRTRTSPAAPAATTATPLARSTRGPRSSLAPRPARAPLRPARRRCSRPRPPPPCAPPPTCAPASRKTAPPPPSRWAVQGGQRVERGLKPFSLGRGTAGCCNALLGVANGFGGLERAKQSARVCFACQRGMWTRLTGVAVRNRLVFLELEVEPWQQWKGLGYPKPAPTEAVAMPGAAACPPAHRCHGSPAWAAPRPALPAHVRRCFPRPPCAAPQRALDNPGDAAKAANEGAARAGGVSWPTSYNSWRVLRGGGASGRALVSASPGLALQQATVHRASTADLQLRGLPLAAGLLLTESARCQMNRAGPAAAARGAQLQCPPFPTSPYAAAR
jgi:hypothetical protein